MRDGPKTAYASSGTIVAYRPVSGGSPRPRRSPFRRGSAAQSPRCPPSRRAEPRPLVAAGNDDAGQPAADPSGPHRLHGTCAARPALIRPCDIAGIPQRSLGRSWPLALMRAAAHGRWSHGRHHRRRRRVRPRTGCAALGRRPRRSPGQPVTAVMAWGYIDQHHLEAGTPFDPQYSADVAAKVLVDLVSPPSVPTPRSPAGPSATCRRGRSSSPQPTPRSWSSAPAAWAASAACCSVP